MAPNRPRHRAPRNPRPRKTFHASTTRKRRHKETPMRRILAAAVYAAISASLLSAAAGAGAGPRSRSWSAASTSRFTYRPSLPPSSVSSRSRASTSSCSTRPPARRPRPRCWRARCRAWSDFYDHTIDLQSKGKFITDVVQFRHRARRSGAGEAADADKLKDPRTGRARRSASRASARRRISSPARWPPRPG